MELVGQSQSTSLNKLAPLCLHLALDLESRSYLIFVVGLFLMHEIVSNFQKEHEPHVGRLVSCGHGLLDYDGVICITSDGEG